VPQLTISRKSKCLYVPYEPPIRFSNLHIGERHFERKFATGINLDDLRAMDDRMLKQWGNQDVPAGGQPGSRAAAGICPSTGRGARGVAAEASEED
jgi:hypothetical protein